LRRVDKHDLRKIANACGATIVTTLATSEGEEEFSSANLGECEEVYEEAVGDNNFVFFKGMKKCNCSSIIVRGANELMCDEIERFTFNI
jgi:T-complex protein 1 subunit alpha